MKSNKILIRKKLKNRSLMDLFFKTEEKLKRKEEPEIYMEEFARDVEVPANVITDIESFLPKPPPSSLKVLLLGDVNVKKEEFVKAVQRLNGQEEIVDTAIYNSIKFEDIFDRNITFHMIFCNDTNTEEIEECVTELFPQVILYFFSSKKSRKKAKKIKDIVDLLQLDYRPVSFFIDLSSLTNEGIIELLTEIVNETTM